MKTDDNGVQEAVEESISTLEPILGCDKTNATNIIMDDDSKETEAKEREAKKVWRKTALFLCSTERRTLMAMAHQGKSDNKRYHVNHISQ